MAKKKPQRRWVYAPRKPMPPPVPEALKVEVQAKADELIETQLKPRFIEPPPEDRRWNYIIDIWARWHRSFFHFASTYASPGPNALSPTFESPFARMEHVGDGKFNLAYMRHTGKWWEVHQGCTLDQCLKTIREDSTFQP